VENLAMATLDFLIIDSFQIWYMKTMDFPLPKSQGKGSSKPEMEKFWEEVLKMDQNCMNRTIYSLGRAIASAKNI